MQHLEHREVPEREERLEERTHGGRRHGVAGARRRRSAHRDHEAAHAWVGRRGARERRDGLEGGGAVHVVCAERKVREARRIEGREEVLERRRGALEREAAQLGHAHARAGTRRVGGVGDVRHGAFEALERREAREGGERADVEVAAPGLPR